MGFVLKKYWYHSESCYQTFSHYAVTLTQRFTLCCPVSAVYHNAPSRWHTTHRLTVKKLTVSLSHNTPPCCHTIHSCFNTILQITWSRLYIYVVIVNVLYGHQTKKYLVFWNFEEYINETKCNISLLFLYNSSFELNFPI